MSGVVATDAAGNVLAVAHPGDETLARSFVACFMCEGSGREDDFGLPIAGICSRCEGTGREVSA